MDNKFIEDLIRRVIEENEGLKAAGIVCKKCGSDEITKISYGLPAWINVDEPVDLRITSLMAQRQIVLAGCRMQAGSPAYFCRNCRAKFGNTEDNLDKWNY